MRSESDSDESILLDEFMKLQDQMRIIPIRKHIYLVNGSCEFRGYYSIPPRKF